MSIYELQIQSMKDAAKKLIYSDEVSEEDKKKLKMLYHEICDYMESNPFQEYDKKCDLFDSEIWHIAREYDMEEEIADIMDSWAKESDTN